MKPRTITTIAILAAAVALYAAPEPKAASIDTAKGATIALKKNRDDGLATAFVLRAIDDPKQEAQVALPPELDKLKKILFACLPITERDGLGAIRVVPSGSAEFRGLADVRTVKTRRFESAMPFLLEPLYVKETPLDAEAEDAEPAPPRLRGFRLTATVGTRPDGPSGIQETGKEEGEGMDEKETGDEPRVKHTGLLLEIPEDADPGFRYGVKLTPVWKEAGKAIEGFDVSLVSVPRPRPPVR